MNELIADLREVELLKGIGDELLERIASLVTIKTIDPGEVLVSEGTVGADLYFVRSGSFVATVMDGKSATEVGRLGPGQVIGESQLIAGGQRTATVRALLKSVVLHLPAAEFDALAAESEQLREALASLIHLRLHETALRIALPRAVGSDPELLELLSRRATWVRLRRGEILWEQGAHVDGWYVLVSGELSIIVNQQGVRHQIGSVRRGEVLGEVAVLNSAPRSATTLAARESWLARFDASILNEEIMTRNGALQVLVRTLASRLYAKSRAVVEDARVIAVVPRDAGIHLNGFLRCLTETLGSRGLMVDPEMLRSEGVIGDADSLSAEHPGWLRFDGWVESQRQEMEYILLVTDGQNDTWTQAAVARADCVLLLVDADADPRQSELELEILDRSLGSWVPPLWLVLEHPIERVIPTGTAKWLDARQVDHHAHIRREHTRDIARLARWLLKETLGIALSGGGARGFVHLGTAEAMFNANYELDLIAGTSAGAMAGGLLACDEAPQVLIERGMHAVASQGNPFTEFDLPLISMLRSSRLRDGLKQTFGTMMIEDSWIPLRVVATNLTESKQIVFDRGPVWQCVLASSSPPGVMPPVLYDNQLLCDGGLVDNLPVSVLVEAGCKLKVASYVGSAFSLPAPRNGLPTSWALLLDKILGRRRYSDAPTLLMTMLQCISVPAATQLEFAHSAADIFFQPDLSAFPVADFSSAQEMFQTGLVHAKAVLEASPISSL